MAKRLGRRNFLVYGSTAVGASLFLKACIDNETPSPAASSTPNDQIVEEVADGEPVKVGLLHSLSGSMALSEIAVMEVEQYAIDQINAEGGVLGHPIEAIVEDGASDDQAFAEKAEKLLTQDKVSALFGGWTAESRQAILPVLEASQSLLWYPFSQEGRDCSQYIIYGGLAPNQQIELAVDWLLENQGKQFFLIESHTEAAELSIQPLLSEQLKAKDAELVGYVASRPGQLDFSDSLAKIKEALPEGGIIFNRLQGESNMAFFQQLQAADMNADQYPVMALTISEEEIRQVGANDFVGHFATWNYFETLETDINQAWADEFKQVYGETRVITDPMISAYTLVYLWKQAVEQANSFDPEAVRMAAYGQTFESPGGTVVLQPNHHLSKLVRVGQIREDGLFDIIWSSEDSVAPQPLSQYLPEMKGLACDWSDSDKGGIYKDESLSSGHRRASGIG